MAKSFALLLSIITLTFSFSCKKTQQTAASLSSLTDEELKLCKYSGKRFLGIMAPDFQNDVETIQETFSQFFSSKLIEPSYMAKIFKDKKKLAACRKKLVSLGKYQQVYHYGGTSATETNFKKGLQAMYRGVSRARREEPKSTIQVMLAFTSHGAKGNRDSSGKLVLSGNKLMPFAEVADLIYNSVIAKVDEDTGETITLANEVVILMDNCFSGNFIQSLQAYIQRKGVSPKQTKIIAMSSSNAGQTAPGAFQGEKVGVIAANINDSLRDWVADANGDGLLTWFELYEYSRKKAQADSIPKVIESIAREAGALVCKEDNVRIASYQRIRKNYARVFGPKARVLVVGSASLHGISVLNEI